ncbi:MAG: efflux RND transporter periplasmic adaptor subunit [Patescibacteria group bacterium]|nr:efflux RND transporter periplasmic adaptor subunit [Patescibacteria group bacterium]
MTKTKKISLAVALFSLLLFLTACNQNTANTPTETKAPLQVKGQTVDQSRSVSQQYEYPTMVLSEQEARIIAKTSGTVKQLNYKLGDTVKAGSLLARIDDINQGDNTFSFGLNANQVRQAQLAVEQAETNKRNVALTSAESLKGVQIAYESAKIAAEQAKLNLENRQTSINQSYSDLDTNTYTIVDSVANTCGTIISGINSIAHFDPVGIGESPYKDNLGVIDSQLIINAKGVFLATQSLDDQYHASDLTDLAIKVKKTIALAEQTHELVNITKNYVDSSLVGGQFTQTVLSGYQTTVAGYQTQISAALTQINGAQQTLENNLINNTTNADALTKAYELAKEQAKNALQSLATQQASIKSSQDAADLAYRNALINLQSIIDAHSVIAPISGKVTQNFIARGDTVSAGQQLATISSGQTVKFQVYVDEAVLKQLRPEQTVTIINNDGKEIPGKITSLAAQADSLTKRFLAEIAPINFQAADFFLGTVVNIIITTETKSTAENIILPLSTIEIGQNGNSLFIIDNGQAKKISVEIIKISGETAEVKVDLPDTAVIITDGNKLIQEGDAVELIK